MYHILICDDDPDIVAALEIYLSAPDRVLYKAANGQQALELTQQHPIQLILMDVMMPVLDGMAATARLRAQSNIPILFLTAKGETQDKLSAFQTGADDYVTKPFDPDELRARVDAQLRRYTALGGQEKRAGVLRVGGLELDDARKTVTVNGQSAALTPIEFSILRFLMHNPGQVFSTKEIYRRVWGDSPLSGPNPVAVHIRHLREKIEIDPSQPQYLKVVWGQGYKMEKEMEK